MAKGNLSARELSKENQHSTPDNVLLGQASKTRRLKQKHMTNGCLMKKHFPNAQGKPTVSSNVAAIDLGTNSCRLLVANGHGEIVYRETIPTKLGEGLYSSKVFTSAAIERGLNAFKKYAHILEDQNVGRYRAVATASCRMAANGEDFVKLIKDKTNIRLEIIDGYEEARLNLKGAQLNVPENYNYIIVFDIGGGSTEITLATCEISPKILYTISIPWGGRNASEAFDLRDENALNRQNLAKEIADYVHKFLVHIPLDDIRQQTCLVATSSTPLRLAAMVKKHKSYNRENCDGLLLTDEELKNAICEVLSLSLEERKNSPYIGENRAPIFISSCTIFQTIFACLGFKNVITSLKGAQEAIIAELIANTEI